MPRGRPKKNLDLTPEVRESTEVSLMEQIKMSMSEGEEVDGTKKHILELDSPVDAFLNNNVAIDRKFTENEQIAVINLIKILNRYICDVNITRTICTELIKHYYDSAEFRLYSKRFTMLNTELAVDKFRIPFSIKTVAPNAAFNIRLTKFKYDYKSNDLIEEIICNF